MTDGGDKSDLLGSFGRISEKKPEKHPFDDKILTDLRNLLKKSRTGAHLLKISDSYGFSPEVGLGPGDSGVLDMGGGMVVSAPGYQKAGGARQALELAAKLRDAEQGILGYRRDRTDLSPSELDAQNHAKNLDIIVDMCKISEELEDEAPEVKAELFRMGYKDIFEAFKSKNGNDTLIKAYERMIEETKK